jgi:LmbE family N-acetylglucosaminyl deacetylase
MDDTFVDFHRIAGGRNLLVLTAAPGDESLFCAELIAQACALGRPPFVAVLTDGSRIAIPGLNDPAPDKIAGMHAHRTLRATGILGVPDEWFVSLGLYDGTVPTRGSRFNAVVEALATIMWRRDCDVIAVPWAADKRPDYAACHTAGVALATGGIGLVTYRTSHDHGGSNPMVRLRPTASSTRRTVAQAVHAHIICDVEEYYSCQS